VAAVIARRLELLGVRFGFRHGLDCKSMFLQNGIWAGLVLLRGLFVLALALLFRNI